MAPFIVGLHRRKVRHRVIFDLRLSLSNMSVFSLDTSHGNPVTKETVDKLCSQLGVTIKDNEKEDYRRLLAVFHDASEQLMSIDGRPIPAQAPSRTQ